MASSYRALLYACTPLLSWSRASSFLHPVIRGRSERLAAAANTGKRAIRFILVVISFDRPDGPGLSGLAFLNNCGTSAGESIRVAIVIVFRVGASHGSHLH